jgi:hypothetical protein
MANPFDYVSAASEGQEMPDEEAGYSPFLTNRAFSYHVDCVMFANEMNMNPNIPNAQQFEYYKYSLSPRRRRAKWIKNENIEDIKRIREIYQTSHTKALDIFRILTQDQLLHVRRIHYERETLRSGSKP